MGRALAWLALLTGIAAVAFFGILPGVIADRMNSVTPVPDKASPRALALHKTLAIADLHGDTLMWKRSLLDRHDGGHIDLPRLHAGNVALQVFSSVSKTPKNQNYDSNSADSDNITLLAVAQGQPVRTWGSLLERSLWHAEKLRRAEEQSAYQLMPIVAIRSRHDLDELNSRRNVRTKWAVRYCGELTPPCERVPPIGALLSIEGLQNLEGKRENLNVLFKAGFRMAGITHFFDNELAGSMHGEKKGGLTPFGRQIVRDMEAKGMIVDIAHCSHQCVAEVLAMATKPVVSSHGGVQATCKVNRNLTDDEIRGVAKTGGVIGIGYWDAAICDVSPKAIARAIVHVRNLVGIDYVGLGSDFDGATTTGFDTSQLALVTQALINAGLTDDDIAKVMGGNVIRVLIAGLPQS